MSCSLVELPFLPLLTNSSEFHIYDLCSLLTPHTVRVRRGELQAQRFKCLPFVPSGQIFIDVAPSGPERSQ